MSDATGLDNVILYDTSIHTKWTNEINLSKVFLKFTLAISRIELGKMILTTKNVNLRRIFQF
jgi:hypothetical protein